MMWKSAQTQIGQDTTTIMTIGEYSEERETTEVRAWSTDEHLRFLDGLEVYGIDRNNDHSPWELIAAHVQTRNEAETRQHGERYLHALLTQSLLVKKSSGSSAWTPEEDKQFEMALAEWIHTPHAWTKIAMQLPGKTVYDVMDRYDALVRDLTALENGLEPEPITNLHDANMALLSSIAKANDKLVLFNVFKEAYENPCSEEIARHVASAVVGMVSSAGQATKSYLKAKAAPAARPNPEKKAKKKNNPPKKTKAARSLMWTPDIKKSGFTLPPLEGKIPAGLVRKYS